MICICHMQKKSQRTQDDAEQSKQFIEAARKAEADETEEGANQAFKKIVPLSKKPSLALMLY